MTPELYLADALGAVGKPMLRVHTAGSGRGSSGTRRREPRGRTGLYRTVLTLAFEKQSESNAMSAGSTCCIAFQQAAAGRCGRILCPARARLHAAHRGARHRRLPRRGQGPAQRLPEVPTRTSTTRTSPWRRSSPHRCSGTPSATPCPSRPSDGACAIILTDRTCCGPFHRTPAPARVHGQGRKRCAANRPSSRARTSSRRRPARTARPNCLPGRPGSATRAGRSTRSRCTSRSPADQADVAGEPRLRGRGRGLEAHRGRNQDPDLRRPAGESLGLMALHQSHRRLRNDPLRGRLLFRCGDRRGSTRWTAAPAGARPRLWRRGAVLLDAGCWPLPPRDPQASWPAMAAWRASCAIAAGPVSAAGHAGTT